MTNTNNKSSWIRKVGYHKGFLVIETNGRTMLYAGVPSWVPGLLTAGCGGKSIGLAYSRLVKGRYAYQRVDTAVVVRMMEAA